jgi:GT2 family glycosyltransferase
MIEDQSTLPEVTIGIPNLNGAGHLPTCLLSLRSLNYPSEKIEIIVVDNGSTDGSAELLQREFSDVKVIRNDKNLGFAVACNQAARGARGAMVAFLNSDMKVDPNWLLELVKAFQMSSEIVCVGSKILDWNGQAIDFAGAELNFYGHGFQVGYQSRDIKAYDEERPILFACGGAMLIDRAVFLDVGGFDEDYFAFFEDVDLGWRLWLFGYDVMFAPKSIVYHHHHGTASAFPYEQVYVLWERNAIYTWFKNYSQENLEKILPVALLLAVERSLVYARVNKDQYHLKSDANSKTPTSSSAKEPHSYAKRALASLRDEGVAKTLKKMATKGRSFIAGQPTVPDDKDIVTKLGLGTLVAIDDAVANLPKFMDKRKEIQRRRKRSDKEVFKLFGDPFKSSCEDSDYKRTKAKLIHLFGIRDIFDKTKV